jgi:hypothetical protein
MTRINPRDELSDSVLATDQRAGPRELLGFVAGRMADDDIKIDRQHGAAQLRPL